MKVTDSKIQPGSNSAELSCTSSCDLTQPLSYIWFKQEKEIRSDQKTELPSEGGKSLSLNDFDPTAKYSCGVRGHEVSSPALCEFDSHEHDKQEQANISL